MVDNDSYENGVFDVLQDLLRLFNASATDDEVKLLARKYATGEEGLKEIMSRLGINTAISSGDLLEYQNATNNIGAFILDSVINADVSTDDSIMGLYNVFANTFEEVAYIFNDNIKDYLNSGGQKVGCVISLTYITFQVLYKGSFVNKKNSIVGTARLFGKNATSVKRLLYRIRRSNVTAMTYIESNSEVDRSVDETITKLRRLMGG